MDSIAHHPLNVRRRLQWSDCRRVIFDPMENHGRGRGISTLIDAPRQRSSTADKADSIMADVTSNPPPVEDRYRRYVRKRKRSTSRGRSRSTSRDREPELRRWNFQKALRAVSRPERPLVDMVASERIEVDPTQGIDCH